MEECPNCGSDEMMWAAWDLDGRIWFYCLNYGCVDLHPPVDDQGGLALVIDDAGTAGEEE